MNKQDISEQEEKNRWETIVQENQQKRHQEVITQQEKFKTLVIPLLLEKGVKTIEVEFDGSGDSGQVDNIVLKPLDTPLDDEDTVKVNEHIGDFVYSLLEEEHPGWEISDGQSNGSYGTFTFNLNEKTVEVDFNGRIEDIENNNYSISL